MSRRSCLRRRPEPDVPAHPARADQRRVEPVDRHVRGADEVDLVVARPGSRHPELHLADRPRHDERRVEQRVELARETAPHERRVVDAVHHDEQLVERHAAAHPPIPPGNMKLKTLAIRSWKPETPVGCGARDSKSRSRQARVSTIRSPDGSRDPSGPKNSSSSALPETSGSNP